MSVIRIRASIGRVFCRIALLFLAAQLGACKDARPTANAEAAVDFQSGESAKTPSAQREQTLRIAYFNVPPHVSWDEKGKRPVGALYDLLEEDIAPRLGIRFLWNKPAPIPRILKELENGNVDAAAIMAKSPEREAHLLYPTEPFWKSNPVLIVLKTNPLERINSIDDLLGMRIGYMQNSFVSPFMRDSRIQWSNPASASSVEQNLNRLLIGHIDAQYNLESTPLLGFATEEQLDKIRFLLLPEESLLYTVFGPRIAAETAERYSAALAELGGIEYYTREYLGRYIDVARLPR